LGKPNSFFVFHSNIYLNNKGVKVIIYSNKHLNEKGEVNVSKKDTCEIYCYDEEKVNRVQEEIEKADISNISKVFKVIGDENRTKIAYALCQEDELCVCDVANILGTSVATASHHLRTLHKLSILRHRKEGKLAFYSLDDDHIKQLILIALEHNQEVKAHV